MDGPQLEIRAMTKRGKLIMSYTISAWDNGAEGVVQSYEIDRCLDDNLWHVIEDHKTIARFASRSEAFEWAKQDLKKYI